MTAPHRSFYDLPFSNGFSSAKFNVRTKTVDSFKNHIYCNLDRQTQSVNLVESVDLALADPESGTRTRLSEMELESIAYLNGTGIVRAAFALGDSSCVVHYFSSFLSDNGDLNAVVELPDRSTLQVAADIRLNNATGTRPAGPGTYETGVGTLSVAERQAGNTYHLRISLLPDAAEPPRLTGTPDSCLRTEKDFWEQWHSQSVLPEGMNEDQRLVYRQSLAILKMGQCREPGRPNGQILASLPPGMWNICWIRDAAYAVNGLVLSGHTKEAGDAIRFFLNADAGKYESFKVDGQQVGIGVPYQISVCRYFGNGTEESDGKDDPNIELDGFGLFLWILETYHERTGDTALVREYWAVVSAKIADVLVHCIDPECGLIRKDSSIWERHIRDNGKERGMKHFAYTTLTAIRGLNAASRLAEIVGNNSAAKRYSDTASSLVASFMKHQVDPKRKVIKDTLERHDIERFMDASVVEAINFAVVEPDSEIAHNTIAAFDTYLGMKHRNIGYFRNRDGGSYDNQEWVVLDLRIATALNRMGLRERAAHLVRWVTDQSRRNFDIIAELYEEKTADYKGSVPMCGFGPGAYISYFWGV